MKPSILAQPTNLHQMNIPHSCNYLRKTPLWSLTLWALFTLSIPSGSPFSFYTPDLSIWHLLGEDGIEIAQLAMQVPKTSQFQLARKKK